MPAPTVVDLPHSLGRAEAKRRVAARLGELPGHLPGGAAEVHSTWRSEHELALDIAAMGQRLSATLDIQDRIIRVTMALPPMLAFMAGAISAAVQKKGSQLLLGKD
ncbi:polyhydroxyalkanoic acid system family protein [Sphingomonas jatrophae]|uniref:Putative polyhydroxyalkanoic acid system protein (PHA_gran_rgn) n=1 Tax=Sphingomonas jatrophae TaxID=1166337 RepID=A0A1I6JXJ2_9SPHN|nr:polyhydroxyalkanoic acid system family protein [Sphingomonas jatrophae]SFR83666.1 Putative polyhydroxyalkanoic acid system protein (PHA_gran_rgn) [Sphingomonas jatrophae]